MNKENYEAINRVLHHIHTSAYLDFQSENLAKIAGYSRFHFSRVFKEVFAETLSAYLMRFRLEFAALKLLQHPQKSVTSIASLSGFASSSTFNRYFKDYFLLPPKQFREQKLKQYTLETSQFCGIDCQIKKIPQMGVLYLRHRGYDSSIKELWQKLLVSCNVNENDVTMIGVHHNYPIITPKHLCHYVACIKSEYKEKAQGTVGHGYTNGGYYAIFSFSGVMGDILKFMDYVYLFWLPNSAYESDTRVPMIEYKTNHFLDPNGMFEVDFYLPIQYN